MAGKSKAKAKQHITKTAPLYIDIVQNVSCFYTQLIARQKTCIRYIIYFLLSPKRKNLRK